MRGVARRGGRLARGLRAGFTLWATLLTGVPLAARADSLPPAVAACAAEKDVLKRLSCFDREVAPYLNHVGGESATNAVPPATANAPAVPAVPAVPAAPVAAVVAAPVAGSPGPQAPPSVPVASAATNGPVTRASTRIDAHVTRIEYYPNLIVHLDNEQIWQEIDVDPVDPHLHAGDVVRIDRSTGSWWLTAPNGAVMKVRQKR